MNIKNQPQDRQQILINLHTQYLMNEVGMGHLLVYLRKDLLGMSQQQYATLVGISRRTLSYIEQDKGKLTQSVVDKVFKPLGLKAGLLPTHEHIVEKIFKLSERG